MITTHFNFRNRKFYRTATTAESGTATVDALNSTEIQKNTRGGVASNTMKTNSRSLRSTLLKVGLVLSLSGLPVLTTAEKAFGQISEEAPISTTGEPIAQQVESVDSTANPNSIPIVPGQASQLGGIQQVQPTGNVYFPQSSGFQNQNPTGKPFFINTQIKVITPFNGQPSTEFLLQAGAGFGKSDAEIQSNNNKMIEQGRTETQNKAILVNADTQTTIEQSRNAKENYGIKMKNCATRTTDEAKERCEDKADKEYRANQKVLPDGSKIKSLIKDAKQQTI